MEGPLFDLPPRGLHGGWVGFWWWWVYLGPLKVHGIHEGALKVFDSRVLTLQQAFKLQVWIGSERRRNLDGGVEKTNPYPYMSTGVL